jgi:hypothetical protein
MSNIVITISGELIITLEKNSVYNDTGASASDGSQNFPVDTSFNNLNLSQVGSYDILYTVTTASNETFSATRIINVIDTTAGPTITILSDNPYYVEKGKIYNDPGATLTDPSFVLNTDASNVNTSVAGNYHIIYSANDTLGNISYTIRNVLVKDVNFPNITPIGDNPTIVNIDTSYNELGATLENSLSFNTVFNNVNVQKEGNYGIIYTAKHVNNYMDTKMRSVIVESSNVTIFPVNLSLSQESPLYIYKDSSFNKNIAVTNGISLNIAFDNVDVSKIGNYGIVYVASNLNDNNTNTIFLEVRVREIIITPIGNNPFYLQINSNYTDQGAQAIDNCGNELTVTTNLSDVVPSTEGDYVAVYTSDTFSNNMKKADDTYRVIFVRENIDPNVNIPCLKNLSFVNVILADGNKWSFNNNNLYKEKYGVGVGTYTLKNIPETHPMAIISNSNLISYIGDTTKKQVKTVDGNIYNFYHGDISLNVSGDFTNASTYCYNHGYMGGLDIFTFTEQCNLIDIDLKGDNPLVIEKNTAYKESGAIVDNEYTLTINSSNVDTTTPGTYTVTYEATDSNNNKITKTRTIIVKDRTPPTITLSGDNPLIIVKDTSYNELGAFNSDNLPVTVTFNNVNTNQIGIYSVVYNAMDSNGNVSNMVRKVYVRDPSYQFIDNQAGAVGDPYITTIGGEIYKIKNISGTVRLLQGYYGEKLLTFNAELDFLSDLQYNELLEWRDKKLNNRTFNKHFKYNEKPAFFSNYFVSWGEEFFIIDANSLKIKKRNYEINKFKIKNLSKEYPWSDKKSKAKVKTIQLNDIKIDFKSFKNKDIKNGFTIHNATLITERTGLLQHTIYTKDSIIDNIKDTKPIKQQKNRKNKKVVLEQFIEDDKTSKLMQFKVY